MPQHERRGPYDELYEARPQHVLWGPRPGRLIAEWLRRQPPRSTILDAGCGDGKNALAMRQAGHVVVGFDVSRIAIAALQARALKAGLSADNFECCELVDYQPPAVVFDVIVSYGLLHCLDPASRVAQHRRLTGWLRPGGVLLFTCLTSELPMPQDHRTPAVELVSRTQVQEVLVGFSVIRDEAGVLREDHEPLVGPHRHSAIWVVARKDAR